MRIRHVMVYVALAIAAGGLYLFDVHRRQAVEQARDQERLVFRVAFGDIERISLRRATQTIDIVREACPEQRHCWRILEPLEAPADAGALAEIAVALAEMRFMRNFQEEGEVFASFGLEEPSLSVFYETKDGSSGGIFIGDESPVGDGYYGRRAGAQEILILPPWVRERLDKSLFDLREKRLFDFDPASVVEAGIEGPGVKWDFVREEDGWHLREDPEFPLDSARVETVLGRFIWARAASFEDAGVFDAVAYGLDAPRYRIRLSDGQRTETLLVGGKTEQEGEGFYGRMLGGNAIFTVRGWLVADLPPHRDLLRAPVERGLRQEKEEGH